MSTTRLFAVAAVVTTLMGGGAATIVARASDDGRPATDPGPALPSPSPAPETTGLTDKEIVERLSPTVVRLIGENGYGEQSGSAVVIDAEEGLVLTNAHVVAGTTSLRATVNGEDAGPARIEGQASCEDLAVVRLDSTDGLQEAEFADTSDLEPMDHVVALGFPTSLEAEPTLSATSGAVSKPEIGVNQDGAVAADLPEYRSVIQHTALIEHGSSGGPLFDEHGKVVGINTLGLDGQAWAISSDHAQEVMEELIAGQSPAYLGWSATPIPDFVADLDDTTGFEPLLDVEGGLILTGIEPGSPAAAADLRPGDLVFELNGQPTNTVADVCQVMQSQRPGASVQATGYMVETDESGIPVWSDASFELQAG